MIIGWKNSMDSKEHPQPNAPADSVLLGKTEPLSLAVI